MCCIIRTMNYLPFSLANGSHAYVLVVGKHKKELSRVRCRRILLILLPNVELVQNRTSLFSVCVCAFIIIHTENEERKERKK